MGWRSVVHSLSSTVSSVSPDTVGCSTSDTGPHVCHHAVVRSIHLTYRTVVKKIVPFRPPFALFLNTPSRSKDIRPVPPFPKDYHTTAAERETNDLLRSTLTDETRPKLYGDFFVV